MKSRFPKYSEAEDNPAREHIHCCWFLDGKLHIIRDRNISGKLFFIMEFFEDYVEGNVELNDSHALKTYSGIILNIESIMKDIEETYVNYIMTLKNIQRNQARERGESFYVH